MGTTIQAVIDTIMREVLDAQTEDTVDTFKCGDPTRDVTGIVTTFMATRQVLNKAVDLGANLVITHEPTYYNHRDETGWLRDDPVYLSKRAFLDDHGLTVWRFHDNWHRHRPDGIETGFVELMGWQAYQHPQQEGLVTLPPMPLPALVALLKQRLDMRTVRVVAAPGTVCSRTALFLGSGPGHVQIEILGQPEVDTLICGETVEWQTCEYARDAAAAGLNKALIVLGHEKSEEAGMRYLADWLRPKLSGVAVTHVPAGDPLEFA